MMRAWILAAGVTMGFGSMACTIQTGDADRFREPLPAEGSVSLSVPGGAGGSGTKTLDLSGSKGSGGASSDAQFYRFTRTITTAMDLSTTAIVSVIWAVAQTEPTTISGNKAVWGPAQGNALDPVTWRLVITETSQGTYDYALEGRPRASTSDADFKAILKGRGYGKAHPLHESGNFELDADVARALDPAKDKEDFSKAKVVYDVRQFPKTISMDFTTASQGLATAKVSHLAGGAGALDLTARGDVEDDGAKDGKLEDVTIKSQWNTSGAGRADASVSGGSLPGTTKVDIVECWSSSFSLAYYKDSSNTKPTVGAASACPTF